MEPRDLKPTTRQLIVIALGAMGVLDIVLSGGTQLVFLIAAGLVGLLTGDQ